MVHIDIALTFLQHKHLTQIISDRIMVLGILLEPDLKNAQSAADRLALTNEKTELTNLLNTLRKG